jgi:hypothetical protein
VNELTVGGPTIVIDADADPAAFVAVKVTVYV